MKMSTETGLPGRPSREQALNCRPVKNPEVTTERLENGDARLHYLVRPKPLFSGLLRRLGALKEGGVEKKLQLDELGTAVWDLIDEGGDVRKIVESFAARYQLHPREAEVSVTTFLRELGRRGLVGLQGDGE